MPWSNQSGGGGGPWGGGGNNGGNNGGPWGNGGGQRPPRGNGGGGGTPPDLEDLIRKGQDQLKNALPGGGSSGVLFGIVGIALFALYLAQAFYTIQEDELGVELLFGKPKADVSTAGLHFHFWPIETVEIANTAENQINIGSTSRSGTSGLMLSGDQNIVDVKFTVLYQVTARKIICLMCVNLKPWFVR